MLTLGEDGSTSQTRFLALAAAQGAGVDRADTTWTIPAKVVYEGDGELALMLTGETGGEGGRKLMKKVQELQGEGKWFKVRRAMNPVKLHESPSVELYCTLQQSGELSCSQAHEM